MRTEGETLFQAEGLGKSFGGLRAVDGVDLRIPAGEITAIIGPNGAGKTTLFNLMSGFLPPTTGRLTFRGEEITGLPPHRIVRLGIARTFQTTRLFSEATVLENVVLGYRLRTRSGVWDALLRSQRHRREEEESRERAREALRFVEALHLEALPVTAVSQEARKRVAIAVALATRPTLLLLDEPAAGVNPEETVGLMGLIRKLVDHGLTVCLVEHKMRMVMEISHRIVVLNYGKKIAEGAPAEIAEDPAVIEAYLGASYRA